MIQAISCPSVSDLQRFLLGQSADQESASLEEHLLHCDNCLRVMQASPVDDPLVSALRQGCESATPAPRSELLEKLRLRLRNRGPSSPGEDTAAGDNTGVPISQPSAMEATEGGGLALAPAQQPDEIGRLAGYRILKELGRGGMGVVYQAEDIKLKRLVALKAMLPTLAADPVARQRFLREAQAMAAVRHDHVVTVFNVDEINGVPFLAMEFLQGLPLDKWLKEGRKPSVAQILRMGREIAEGLAAAHERGLIHRDVKPGNVWLDSAHKGRVKILDFGLARAGTEDVHLTRSGAIVGTPAYMAPEQARADKVDARSDLFSLGCVLYKLCTGAMPFAGDTTMSLLMALALDHPKPVRELNPGIPTELSDLVTKLLEKDPTRRPATAREVVQAIQALERRLAREQDADDRTEMLQAAPQSPAAALAAPPRRAPRRRWPMVAAAVVFLVLLGGLIAGGAALIHIQTPQGDYVIETDDPDFFFQVHDGVVKLEDRKNNKTYTLKVVKEDKGAGQYDVEVSDGGDLAFKTKTFTIKRGEKAALRAWFEPKSVAANPAGQVDDAWVKQVASLPAEKQVKAVAAKLKELNPGFDGEVGPQIEGGVVTDFQFITDKVTDISPLQAFKGLRSLNCSATGTRGPLTDLSPLTRIPLERLAFHNTQVSNLSALRGMPLTSVAFHNTPVADLSPLRDMKLTYLECGGTEVSDLSPLKDMKLKALYFGNVRVSDLSPLKDMKLEELSCIEAQVTDLSPLKGMPLKNLHCDFKPERDAEILRSIKTLETINGKPAAEFWKDVVAKPTIPPLDEAWAKKVRDLPAEKQVEEVAAELKRRNPGFDGKVTPGIEGGVVAGLAFLTDEVVDISPARALLGLRVLVCIGGSGKEGRLSDLSPLKGMPLTQLECARNQLTGLSPLKGMPLTSLNCGDTKVADLSPLKDMPLTALYCGATQVADLSPLKGMPLVNLDCSGTLVSDLSPLKNMKLTKLQCQTTMVSDLSPLKDMPLTYLSYELTKVSDLSPLKDMKLTYLGCRNTATSDFSVLKNMPLAELWCDFKPERDAAILRSIKTLETINGKPAADFWKGVDEKKP